MKAVILAAGFGKRLRPLTEYLPKVLVPILGIPAIEHVLNHLFKYDIQDVGVNVHYRSEQIISSLNSLHKKQRNIRVSQEEQILGTGGALYHFRDFLQGKEPFWVHNGDIICDLDLISALSVHQKKRALVTLILWDYPPINSVVMDQAGNVIDFLSKRHILSEVKDKYEENRLMTYTGIAILDPKILDCIPNGYSEMPEIYQNIIKVHGPGKICGVKGRGQYWADFGTLSRYLDLHQYLLLKQRVNCTGKAAPESFIHKGGESIVIAKSARLNGFVSIGNDCVIEGDVFLKDCILWPGTKVQSGTKLQRSVLSKDFIIQENDEKDNE